MSGSFEIELRFTPGEQGPAGFEGFLDAVADELTKIGIEPDYAASIADLTATWWVDAPDASEQSLIGALTALQTAFHAAGCGTAAMGATHEVTAARHLAPA